MQCIISSYILIAIPLISKATRILLFPIEKQGTGVMDDPVVRHGPRTRQLSQLKTLNKNSST